MDDPVYFMLDVSPPDLLYLFMMVGKADDASAIAFNPAGITQIPGSSYMTGLTFIMPRGTVTEVGGSAVNLAEHTFIPPHFYYTRQMSDTVWFELGLMSRFGLGTDFPEDWFGRYNSYYANIQSVSLNPNIAWKATDDLSLSVGVEGIWFEYGSKKALNSAPTLTGAYLLGDDYSWGWNLGAHWKANDKVRVGFSYRSEIELTIEGNAEIYGTSGHVTRAHGDITLPEMFMGGVAVQVNDKTSVEVGAIYTGWSSYDEMVLVYEHFPLAASGEYVKATPKNYKNVWRYQLGIEYKKSPEWTWRFGYTYDQSPIPDDTIDYQLPMSDRHLLSVGFGYTKNDRTWDFAYTYLMADDRTIAGRPGSPDYIVDSTTSNMDANIFVVSYSVRF
ncbi:MAG: outer membrane protein transport protein [Thermovirgaceae bacterium]|nr:outer membrane protein transport protein [Thermovirgaceae bacterium]